MKLRFTQSLISGLLLALASTHVSAQTQKPVKATASLAGCTDPLIKGTARLKERVSSQGIKQVEVELKMQGLKPGQHAVHLHAAGNCTPCLAAAGHFDPGPYGNSTEGNHPYHLGDLPNIEAKKNGRGTIRTQTTRITLSNGPLTLFDQDGSAFVVHENPDTFCPDGNVPGCAGGARIACGIIERVN